MLEPVIPIIKDELNDGERNKFYDLGAEAIKQGKLAVCTLAGGQGSRLGHKGPKGTFVVPFKNTNPNQFPSSFNKRSNAIITEYSKNTSVLYAGCARNVKSKIIIIRFISVLSFISNL